MHVMTCAPAKVAEALATPRESLANARAKATLILAKNGQEIWAENLTSDDIVVCCYPDFPDLSGVLPAACGHLDRKTDPRERLRHHGLPDD